MKRAVITGLGFVTSIGNDAEAVLKSLRETKSGIALFDEFSAPEIPIKLAGTIKEFSFKSASFEDWTFPSQYSLTREQLRSMTPNGIYGFAAMQQAIADSKLDSSLISNPRVGLLSASGGSMMMSYDNLHTMETRGVQRCQPMGIVNGIPGSLYINIGSIYKIKGMTLGFSSACSSSAHALGYAYDQIMLNRQDRVFVLGAEDCSRFNILPFAAVRALSPQKDPSLAPRAFDKKRDGFVGTGGATALVVEELETALARKAPIYAEIVGWAQSADGYNVLAPDPAGDGLSRAMELALESAKVAPGEIDYINAHATSTSVGDIAEIKAIKHTFPEGKRPLVSSTKSLTGHGLSLAGAMEAAFCCLNLRHGFVPVSANITELDPECEGVPVITQPVDCKPEVVMSNSSGFGGTNVSLIFRQWKE